jgi:hypothetical protein
MGHPFVGMQACSFVIAYQSTQIGHPFVGAMWSIFISRLLASTPFSLSGATPVSWFYLDAIHSTFAFTQQT